MKLPGGTLKRGGGGKDFSLLGSSVPGRRNLQGMACPWPALGLTRRECRTKARGDAVDTAWGWGTIRNLPPGDPFFQKKS